MSPDPDDPIGRLLRDTDGTLPPPNYADVWVQHQKNRRRRTTRGRRAKWARTAAACMGTAALFVALVLALLDPTGMSGDLATGPDPSSQFADWATTTTTRSSPPTTMGRAGGNPVQSPTQPSPSGGPPVRPPTGTQPGQAPSPTVPNQPGPPVSQPQPIPTTTIVHPSQPPSEPEPDLEELARQAYGPDYAGFHNGRVLAKLTPESSAVSFPVRPHYVQWSLLELEAFQADADHRVARAVGPMGITFATHISVLSNTVDVLIENSTPGKVELVSSHLLEGPYRIS